MITVILVEGDGTGEVVTVVITDPCESVAV